MERQLDIEPYKCVNYKLCYHAPLFSALQYWGANLDVFLSNDIFVYSFHERDGHVLQCDNIEVIPEKELFLKVGLRQCELELFDERLIMEAIREGYPVFAPIDRYYWEDRKYNGALYLKTHKTHYFLVVGYDLQKREFTVIDIFDNGKEFDVFHNRIGFEQLRQCCEGYREKYRSTWQLSVLEPGEPQAGVKERDYREVMVNNLKSYRETIYESFQNIRKAIACLKQNMGDLSVIADICQRSLSMYIGMSLKNVQGYETTHFLQESGDVGEAYAELSMLHYRMVALFRKMHWTGRYEREQCCKVLEIMDGIYEKEIYAYHRVFSLL